MLVLYRKPSQGIEVRNNLTGKLYSFDYLYNKQGKTRYRINGVERTMDEQEPFYLDNNCEVMVIIISIDNAIRAGIDAPRHYDIRRKEIPFR
jgi:sRNA-binding carbon storage regulator CsrA